MKAFSRGLRNSEKPLGIRISLTEPCHTELFLEFRKSRNSYFFRNSDFYFYFAKWIVFLVYTLKKLYCYFKLYQRNSIIHLFIYFRHNSQLLFPVIVKMSEDNFTMFCYPNVVTKFWFEPFAEFVKFRTEPIPKNILKSRSEPYRTLKVNSADPSFQKCVLHYRNYSFSWAL